MTNPSRRPSPKNTRELTEHIFEFGLHMHRTDSPKGWRHIAGEAGYHPCVKGRCLKTEPAIERSKR